MNDADTFFDGYKRYHESLAKATAINKGAVFGALLAAHITRVAVTFDGEGDSGQIEDIVACTGEEVAALPSIALPFLSATWNGGEPQSSNMPLREAIESLCYDCLSQEQGGWENNDGAFGEFTFHVAEGRIDLDFNARFSDFVNHNYSF